jgi:hypothetical protein
LRDLLDFAPQPAGSRAEVLAQRPRQVRLIRETGAGRDASQRRIRAKDLPQRSIGADASGVLGDRATKGSPEFAAHVCRVQAGFGGNLFEPYATREPVTDQLFGFSKPGRTAAPPVDRPAK